ncbi:2OG-Fe dioxygenase family protein [Enterobacteriaceae bacterium LUAb1]
MCLTDVSRSLTEKGYFHLQETQKYLQFSNDNKASFLHYWENLQPDHNFLDYTYRERRILRYYAGADANSALIPNPDNTYKSKINYGIRYTPGDNHLSYAEPAFTEHPLLQDLLLLDRKIVAEQVTQPCQLAIDIHQFRVKSVNENVSPTTSGIHQDGLDWIFMHYIQSHNTVPVISEIHAQKEGGIPLLRTSMVQFLETLIVNDRQHYHTASEVKQLDKHQAAFRDLLLITFLKLDHNLSHEK